jgi:hypothetical protein
MVHSPKGFQSTAGIDLPWRREESSAIAQFHGLGITDLLVCTAWHDQKQIPIRCNRTRRKDPELSSGQARRFDFVVNPVDLDVERLVLGPGRRSCFVVLVAHVKPSWLS